MKPRILYLLLITSVFLPFVSLSEPNFLWKPLVSVSNATFRAAFLPSYIDLHRDVLPSSSVSNSCKLSLRVALEALDARRNWAVALFNSWAKFPPSGAVRGTLTDFGDYDQCLSSVLNEHYIVPQYCLLDIKLPLPPMPDSHNYYHQTEGLVPRIHHETMITRFLENGTFYRHLEEQSSVFYWATLQLGVCLPKGCTDEDVRLITENNINHLGLAIKSLHCESRPTAVTFTAVQLLAIAVLLLMLSLTVVAAIYDRVAVKKSNLGHLLLWFSPGRNIRKLILTDSSEDELACIHGLRFFSICWVVIGHTLEWNSLNIFKDTFFVREHLSSIFLQLLFKAPYAVETFFYISGLLTSYMALKLTGGSYKKFSYISFFALRYLRLTPQLAIFLLLTTLLPPLFDGPIWFSYMGKISDNCARTWWHSLLYLQDFIDFEHICGIHTWFLANDMQLHWLSLLPVVVLLINRRNGLRVAGALIALSAFLGAIKVYVERFPPDTVITSKTDFRDAADNPSYFYYFYFKPWIHIIPFFIGFLFGDFLVNCQAACSKRVLSKSTKYLLWLLVLAAYLFEIYNTVPYLYGRPYDALWSAFIFPVNRAIWALMLTAIIWLCTTGNGGIVGRMLSWRAFRPLSRMTYSVYLTHAWTLWIALGSRRELIDIAGLSVAIFCCGILVAVYIIGFLFTVIFEAPLFHFLETFKRNIRLVEVGVVEEVTKENIKAEKEAVEDGIDLLKMSGSTSV